MKYIIQKKEENKDWVDTEFVFSGKEAVKTWYDSFFKKGYEWRVGFLIRDYNRIIWKLITLNTAKEVRY